MFAKLTALVGGGYVFPYNVEEPFDTRWGLWTHCRGSAKDDGAPVSVFKFATTDPNDKRLDIARNGIKRLKLLRHPNVLAFKDTAEVQDKGGLVIYLVTEAVRPLGMVLQTLELDGGHKNEYLAMGLYQVASAVSFLNNDCKFIHGNLCLNAVVVTETLDWKLHGFDLLCEHQLPGDFPLQHHGLLIGNHYKPAELAKGEWDVVRQSPPWAIDAWGLGCLTQEVFSGEALTKVEQLRRTGGIPQALLQDYQRLLSSNPSRRLNPSQVAESKFLNNRLVDVVAFMENIALKDTIDKDSFFKKLPGILPAIPTPVAVAKILPLLASALEFGGAPAVAVSSLMLIGSKLDQDAFVKRVVPCLSKLFASTDRGLRRNLLESLDQYGKFLTTPVVEEQIYPHLQNGFSDTNAYIRELTLKAVLTLAPKLTQKTLTQSVLKSLSKLQVDEEPSIRANTTVLLGNIAPYLGEATCKKVLINAFTRALKDSFPPARIAALQAMVTTMDYHAVEELAVRLIPSVAPATIDPMGDIRTNALQCISVSFERLKKHHDKIKADAANSSTPSHSGAAAPANSASVVAGSMLGWAVSSLISSGGTAPASLVKAGPGVVSSPMGGVALEVAGATRGDSMEHVGGVGAGVGGRRPPCSSSSFSSEAGFGPAAAGASRSHKVEQEEEKFHDMDGWDDDDDDLDSLTTQAAAESVRPPPSQRAKPPASDNPLGGSSSGWDNKSDDGWEAPEMKTTAQRPLAAMPRRPVSSSGCGAGARVKKTGAMKLGAQKLGAQKLGAGLDTSLKADDWL